MASQTARVSVRHDLWRSYVGFTERLRISEGWRLVALVLLTFAVAGAQLRWPQEVPSMAYGPVVVIGGLFLPTRLLLLLFLVVAAAAGSGFVAADAPTGRMAVSSISGVVTMGVMWLLARARGDLGTFGIGGERMLRELRTRHGELATLPALPEGWHAEAVVAGAHGDSFAGDVLLSSDGFTNRHVEFCLVDVSGKGLRAGTRALMVASAFSGLLGQVEPWRFVSAANSYLVRQQWKEGFATAVHLDLDPVFGHFSVSCAGHPPVMRYRMATGEWTAVNDTAGPALGLMDDVGFPRINGELAPGDALILYTDGIIETRDGELADGIDWMGGVTERAINDGTFSGLAQELISAARGGREDDRAVLVVWRTW